MRPPRATKRKSRRDRKIMRSGRGKPLRHGVRRRKSAETSAKSPSLESSVRLSPGLALRARRVPLRHTFHGRPACDRLAAHRPSRHAALVTDELCARSPSVLDIREVFPQVSAIAHARAAARSSDDDVPRRPQGTFVMHAASNDDGPTAVRATGDRSGAVRRRVRSRSSTTSASTSRTSSTIRRTTASASSRRDTDRVLAVVPRGARSAVRPAVLVEAAERVPAASRCRSRGASPSTSRWRCRTSSSPRR